MSVTFDGPNKEIILGGVGDLEFSVADIYSLWKQWVLAGNAQFLPAMRSVGGDPITDSKFLGATYFLTNGWRLRTKEESHTLTLNGNLYTDPAGDDPVLPTAGAFTVQVQQQLSNLVDSSVENLSLLEYGGTVYLDMNSTYEGDVYPFGTAGMPVNNIADADAIADRYGLHTYVMRGNFAAIKDYFHTSFVGGGPMHASVFDANGFEIHECDFTDMVLTGVGEMSGEGCDLKDCILMDYTGFHGTLCDTGLMGTLVMNGTVLSRGICGLLHGTDPNPLSDATVISFDDNSYHMHLSVDYGEYSLRNIGPTSVVRINAPNYNLVRIDASVADTALIIITGQARVENNSNAQVIFRGTSPTFQDAINLMEKILRNRVVTDPTTGVMTVYDDDNVTPLVTADLFQDAAGTQRYNGVSGGVERRDRLE